MIYAYLCQRDENMDEIIRLAETISENLPGSQGLTLHWIPSVYHTSTFFLRCVPSLSLTTLLPFLYLRLGVLLPLPDSDGQMPF